MIEAAARTDVGERRSINEDAVLAQRPVFVVADGMGGHSAGDRASAAAVRAFGELAERGAARALTIADVDAALDEARAAVEEIARGTERGAGCTLSGVVLVENEGASQWYVLNIGDSRVYQHRGASLAQVTADHSLRAELTAAGHADAATAPRNVITRALGAEDSRHDAWLLPVRTGTRLLVCSDGLTTELSDEELRAVLTIGGRPDTVADELVRRACESGGRDNISVIVVDTVEGGLVDVRGRHAANEADEDDTVDETTLDVTKPVDS